MQLRAGAQQTGVLPFKNLGGKISSMFLGEPLCLLANFSRVWCVHRYQGSYCNDPIPIRIKRKRRKAFGNG